jgi:hypothetical protein
MTDALGSLGPTDLRSLPIDLDAVADRAGLQVQVRSDLPKAVAGFLYPGPSWGVVVVNGCQPKRRRRLDLAHELAHWCLGDRAFSLCLQVDDDGFPACRVGRASNSREKAVNAVAAELLMPERLVRAEWRRSRDVAALSGRFDVSGAVMERRLGELALLGEVKRRT